MTTEIEETLARELREVADGVHVPPMPALATAEGPRSRASRLWQPLLVAAAVAVAIGVGALVLGQDDSSTPQPAPSPSATASPRDDQIPAATPTIAHIVDRSLYVDGRQVPGDWWSVESRGAVWLALHSDGSWWTGGPGVEPRRIDAQIDQPPAISPNGSYVAFVDLSDGTARLSGFDTQPAGEGFGYAPIDLPGTEDGIALSVRAVTDEGDVIVQGTRTSLMWRALHQDQRTVVDLTETAPDQVILQGTAAGLVVVDGADGATDATGTAPYLADISTEGDLTRTGALPTHDDLTVSPEGTWLVRSPAGTLGGEVAALTTLDAQPVGGDDEVTLAAPDGWGFANGTWAWEDDETLISVLLPAGSDDEADAELARCSVALGACRALEGPSPDAEARSHSAEEALDSVVQAVVSGDRAALVDQAVIDSGEWDLLVEFSAGEGGSGSTCRDNGGGTKDCEIIFDADLSTTYYAILEPARNAYGWRVSFVSIAGV